MIGDTFPRTGPADRPANPVTEPYWLTGPDGAAYRNPKHPSKRMHVSRDLVTHVRRSVTQAMRSRVGDTCMFGPHPPYVADRNGWGLGFCDLSYEDTRLRWWYRG